MPIVFKETKGTNLLHLRLVGKLARNDYVMVVPAVERMIELHGKIRMLVEMVDFNGWDMAALWKDLKFDARHYNNIERVAMVGEKTWQKWMTGFCQPFTSAEVNYFDQSEMEEAMCWVKAGEKAQESSSSTVRSIRIADPERPASTSGR